MSGAGAAAVRCTAEDAPRIRPIPVTLIFALSTHDVDNAIFHVASALQVPVLVLVLLALAATIFELGSFLVELQGRRRRTFGAAPAEHRRGARRA